MADNSIAVDPGTGGSAKNVDTRTNTGGDHRQVIIIGDQTANDAIAVVTSADAGVATSEYGMVVRPLNTDAAKHRVSAILVAGSANLGYVSSFIDNGSLSAKSSDAATFRVSAIGTISSLGLEGTAFLGQVSATLKSGTANIGYVSAVIDNGSLSAKSSDAGTFLVSSKQGDAALHRVSAIQDGAAALNVSAKSDSGATFRVSSFIVPQTAGGLSTHMSLSVSSSQNVKSSAGQLYGYYAFNKATSISFLKLYNVSGAISLGTDVPVLTIPLPISGGANAFSDIGLAGFTNGIGIAATSGLPVDNTALPAASAIVVDLFYK